MTNPAIVTGLSVTAAVVAVAATATTVVDRKLRRTRLNARASTSPSVVEGPSAAAATVAPVRSASQDTTYVFGNMMLITNM